MNRIRELRESKGLSQTELGGMLGRDQTLISKLENGHIDFDMYMADKLTNIFNVPIEELRVSPQNKKSIRNSDSPLQPPIAESMGRVSFGPDMVPILGHANASSSAVMLNYEDPIGEASRHPNQRGVKNAFYLRIYDESMVPRYYPGERAAVNGGSMAISKEDCVIEMNNGEVYIKQFLRTTSKEIICHQLNPNKEWKRPLIDVKAIHAVVGRG